MNIKKILVFSVIALSFVACKNIPTMPEVKNLPTIISFYAIPSTIDKGQSTTLYWSTSNATTVSIDQGIGFVSTSGDWSVSPTTTTTYTLTAGNKDGTVNKSTAVTVKEVAVLVLDGEPVKRMTSYGCPQFTGYVKNTGPVTAYNAMIQFRAYSDVNRTTIIDTASGFPADLGDIGSGQRAYFEATFFKLNSWDQIKSWDYQITWLNKNMPPGMQRGITVGWGR